MLNNKKTKKNKGFTLIEVVAVIAIMGILTTILVPNITKYVNEARKVKVVDQARKVVLAVEVYNTKSNTKIDKDSTTEKLVSVKSKLTEYISDKDINLLDENNKTVKDCYKVVDSDNYKFTLGDGNILGVITP